MIIAIDPGLRVCGVAVFNAAGELTSACVSEVSYEPEEEIDRALSWALMVEAVAAGLPQIFGDTHLVLELQEIYTHRKGADPNDLLDLAGVVGGLATRWPNENVFSYLPKVWKGQVPKPTMSERVKTWLKPGELQRVDLPKAKKKQHDVWHAVGLGVYHLRQKGARK